MLLEKRKERNWMNSLTKNIHTFFSKNVVINYLVIAGLAIFFVLLTILNYYHAVEFSFVDEYNNWVIAKYLLEGKHVYKDIYLNHQMMMAYISTLIQGVLQIDSLYQLVLTHRLLVLLFAFVSNILLIIRFRWVGIAFFLIFELIKYYFFGNLFLGESLIVYPLVYLFGLALLKLKKQKIYKLEYYLTGLLIWFVFFTREPYVPVAGFLYLLLLFGKSQVKEKVISIIIFSFLSLLTLLTVSLPDFVYQVVVVNFTTILPSEVQSNNVAGIGLLKIIFYPIFIFISGEWTFLRLVEIFVAILFFMGVVFSIYKKQVLFVVVIFLTLALSAVRITEPGKTFYAAFHMLPWFGLFVIASVFLVRSFQRKIIKRLAPVFISIIVVFALAFPNPFIRVNKNMSEVFYEQYSLYFVTGEVVKRLADTNDTLFVNGYDSLVYWHAGVRPSFKYTFYYPETYQIDSFNKEVEKMFAKNPPTFYFQDCIVEGFDILDQVKKQYTPLQYNGSPTCLFVYNPKVAEMEKKIDRVQEYGYHF